MFSTTLIAIFNSRQTLLQAVEELSTLELIDVRRAVVVAKAASGETVVVDNEIQPGDGRKVGMRFGALMTALGVAQLGALALPGIGPLIAIGAGVLFGGLVGGATGQFAATLMSFGFRREQVDALAGHLQEGEVALIIQLDSDDLLPQLRSKLNAFDAEILESKENPPSAADFKRLPRRSSEKQK